MATICVSEGICEKERFRLDEMGPGDIRFPKFSLGLEKVRLINCEFVVHFMEYHNWDPGIGNWLVIRSRR